MFDGHWTFYVAQGFGLVAMVALFASYQQKTAKQLTACKLVADAAWILHYSFMGVMTPASYTGIVPNGVGIFRELVFMQRKEKKWANHVVFPIVFVLCGWGFGVWTIVQNWEKAGAFCFLPLIASTVVTIGLWTQRTMVCKIACFCASASFLVYNIVLGSPVGIFGEAVSEASLLVFFVRYAIEKRRARKGGGA